jgi:hypothetical protein
MSVKEILSYIKESRLVQDLGFGTSLYWDETQLSWVVTDGERRLTINETKALELVEEMVTTF